MSLTQDDPAEIKDQILSLKHVEIQIKDLEKQLGIARRTRDEIQQKLAAYRASRAPIARVPNELLALAFGYITDAQRTRNRNLQLVSRLWRDMVLASPRLWSDIVVELKSPTTIISSWKYATACLAHSKDTLLDIRVDGRNYEEIKFPDPVENLLEQYQRFEELHPGSTSPLQIISNGDAAVVPDQPAYEILYTVGVMIVEMTFSILKGQQNEFMGRWRSFSFEMLEYAISSEDVSAGLWNTLQGQAVNLVNLEFSLHGGDDEWRNPQFLIAYIALQDLRKLKAFRTNLPMSCAELPCPTEHLHELELLNRKSSIDFIENASSRFRSLRILGLNFSTMGPFPESDHPIVLPLLEMLYLRGRFHVYLVNRFSTPRLNHLCIMACPAEIYPATKAFSSVETLSWDVPPVAWGDNDVRDRLGSLLKQMESLVRIRLRERHKDVNLDGVEWLQALNLEERTPPSLTEIQMIDKCRLLTEGHLVRTLPI